MDGAFPGQPFLVHHKGVEEHAVPSGSDHTRNEGYMSQNRVGDSRSQEEAAQETLRKRSSRICKMEVKKRQEEEVKAEEEAEVERRAEEKRVARQRRKQEREQQQGIEEQQRRMQGIHPEMPAHRDGVAYMLPAGMMHSLPNGHMIAAPAPQMMATAAPAQQMRATTMPHTTQQQPASRMHGGAPWPAAPPGSRSQPTSLNGSEQGAGAAPVNGVKQEARTPPPKGRAPSGWTPVAAKKLPRNCFGPRSTKRRKPRRNRLKSLTATAQSWNLPEALPAAAAPTATPAAAAPAARAAARPQPSQQQQAQQQQQQHQPPQHPQQQQAAGTGSHERYMEVQNELSRRQHETAQQLDHLVQEQRISLQSANIKMSEVKQLSEMTLQLTMAHHNLSLQQLISMAQTIIHNRQQQAEQQQQAAMASQLQSHPVFARLNPEQQRQLTAMQPHQIRQVLSNLAQHGSMGQIPSPTAHGAQPPGMHARMVPTQMSHSMPNQAQMMPPAAPTSMHMMPMHTQMHASQPPTQQQQQQQAAAAMQQHNSAARMQGIPQSMPPGSQAGVYPMQQMSMLDDPLMTTLH